MAQPLQGGGDKWIFTHKETLVLFYPKGINHNAHPPSQLGVMKIKRPTE